MHFFFIEKGLFQKNHKNKKNAYQIILCLEARFSASIYSGGLRADSLVSRQTGDSWPSPSVVSVEDGYISVSNDLSYPVSISKHDQFCQVRAVSEVQDVTGASVVDDAKVIELKPVQDVTGVCASVVDDAKVIMPSPELKPVIKPGDT